ncbi:hypothetical protein GX50_08914 [[Emmonsia] crescens]|uniref:Uncharacterized protein n=1 Tax=[Emmonsia] crescens TaxID=73230 RepID=A0A2B7Z4L4_9EURO|nr:hypothetical protein GX50_08914 [Emmonsia crescens]
MLPMTYPIPNMVPEQQMNTGCHGSCSSCGSRCRAPTTSPSTTGLQDIHPDTMVPSPNILDSCPIRYADIGVNQATPHITIKIINNFQGQGGGQGITPGGYGITELNGFDFCDDEGRLGLLDGNSSTASNSFGQDTHYLTYNGGIENFHPLQLREPFKQHSRKPVALLPPGFSEQLGHGAANQTNIPATPLAPHQTYSSQLSTQGTAPLNQTSLNNTDSEYCWEEFDNHNFNTIQGKNWITWDPQTANEVSSYLETGNGSMSFQPDVNNNTSFLLSDVRLPSGPRSEAVENQNSNDVSRGSIQLLWQCSNPAAPESEGTVGGSDDDDDDDDVYMADSAEDDE